MNLQQLFSFEVVPENNLKITYNGNEEITVGITLILRGGNKLDSFVTTFFCTGHWITPNINYKGCTHISFFNLKTKKHIYNWLLPPEITQGIDKQKIIGIGLNKTGTTSFEKDLKQFGYIFPPTTHGAINIISDIYHGDYSSLYSYLDNPRFTAFQDVPYSLPDVYKKIYEKRPNDIYVLTIRDNVDMWVKSVIKFHKWMLEGKNINGSNDIFEYFKGFESVLYSNFNVPLFKIWGLKDLNNLENDFRLVYEKHNKEVIDFFESKKSSNFIVIDVSKKGELKKLTNWLNIKNDKQDFSWENKSK